MKKEEDARDEPGRPSASSAAPQSVKVAPQGSADEEDEDDIGPKPPAAAEPGSTKRKADGEPADDDSDSDGFDEDGADEVDRTPISHEIVLKDHNKVSRAYRGKLPDRRAHPQVVSAIAVDPSGARFASGSHDYDTKLWDFGGMDSRLKPFKSFEANGNYHVSEASPALEGPI